MPIQIKELHIKINIEEPAKSKDSSQSKINSKGKDNAVIASCVEAVMELLEKQKER